MVKEKHLHNFFPRIHFQLLDFPEPKIFFLFFHLISLDNFQHKFKLFQNSCSLNICSAFYQWISQLCYQLKNSSCGYLNLLSISFIWCPTIFLLGKQTSVPWSLKFPTYDIWFFILKGLARQALQAKAYSWTTGNTDLISEMGTPPPILLYIWMPLGCNTYRFTTELWSKMER